MHLGHGQFFHGDCFDVMATLPDASVDMVLCDLPYGTTQNKWDSVLSLDDLWKHYWRLLKPKGVVVLTAAQPFTTKLIYSGFQYFKYDWVWVKESGTGHLNSKKMPMRNKEDICVFYLRPGTYNPQMSEGKPYLAYDRSDGKEVENYGKYGHKREGSPLGLRYPTQTLRFNSSKIQTGKLHPTQKPVALFEYLIRTYTNEGDVVLDNCIGSGTTAVAAERTNRRWIGIEKDNTYAGITIARVMQEVG